MSSIKRVNQKRLIKLFMQKIFRLFSGFHLSLQACYFQILCQSLLNCSSKYSLYSLFSSAQQSSIPKRERREIDAHLPLYPKIHWRCDVHVADLLLVILHTQKQIGVKQTNKQTQAKHSPCAKVFVIFVLKRLIRTF